jgi:hypothetical protein
VSDFSPSYQVQNIQLQTINGRSDVFTAVKFQIVVIWIMTSWDLTGGNHWTKLHYVISQKNTTWKNKKMITDSLSTIPLEECDPLPSF